LELGAGQKALRAGDTGGGEGSSSARQPDRGRFRADGTDLSLLEHVSPIEWDNVVLYGQYISADAVS
jgi:hypothetical protein